MNRLKNKTINFFDSLYKFGGFLSRYLAFIFEIIFWAAVLYFLLSPLASLFNSIFSNKIHLANSDFILLITAAFILAYTYETKKLRDETIFQRKMSVANDIQFQMNTSYRDPDVALRPLGFLQTTESSNSISRFAFLKALPRTDIGRCEPFRKISDNELRATYFVSTDEGREDFLKALQLQDGEIKAWVLITNGTQFIYTFRAMGDGWKKTLEGSPNQKDQFVLVKKELY